MGSKDSETLNQVALPVVPYDTCKWRDYWWFQGYSGGPLVCQDTPGGPWEVHGITSFGPFGCIMNKKPSTRSSAYLPWISDVICRDIYNEHTSGCGGPKDLTGEDGTISSLDYPSTYSNNAQCQWNIEVPSS
ncbi:hypothetical protein ATANTOWER_025617 [Ataeniobius toweri]|uniref:CUB domain-containing protein n=1 Tax=Ataeniobius toweri TaxID=208326 RepID=A0ABU7A833_9TELE|nr:hypothetical protein [Ataeniobius toweri]